MSQPLAAGEEHLRPRWGVRSVGHVRYWLAAVCVVAQASTLAITWPLWQTRADPPGLPVMDLPTVPFGWILVVSLLLTLVRPRLGAWVHATLLLVSFALDQLRTQPQVIAVAVMLLSVVDARRPGFGRWYLASLWLWAGLHKLLSPDWFSRQSWKFSEAVSLDPHQYLLLFALAVAVSEIVQGILAIVLPRVAAFTCVLMHVSIVIFLSPWFYNWNVSVMPWNVCSAIVGFWLLYYARDRLPASKPQWVFATVLFVAPAGFYWGWVDHGVASVLYSENLPRGLMTTHNGLEEIKTWGALRVPFPNERRLLKQHFELVAQPGEKLHIADPRPWLDDQYFVMKPDGRAVEITKRRFFAGSSTELAGVGFDNPRSLFALQRGGARLLKRTADAMIYAVKIHPDVYRPELLDHLRGLPNLEQLQLAGCEVTDADLDRLGPLDNLVGIGLEETDVTAAGLERLRRLPKLVHIEFTDDTQ